MATAIKNTKQAIENLRQHQERQTGTDLQYRDDAAALPDPQPQTGHYLASDVRE